MINLTLKQMRYFDALARQGHFGRAADACAISQPALSMQIQEMERTLGTPLLERGARG
jgi:LysR family hydrogen peroxide-inducible transcriptional activator